MRIDVVTLFPGMFESVLGSSILRRAAESVADPAAPDDPSRARAPVVSYHLHDIRAWTQDRHGKVDKPPFGGGPGMVMQCQPLWDAVTAVAAMDPRPAQRVLLSPQGRTLTQDLALTLAALPRLLMICGHYEGIDERVLDRLRDDRAGGGLLEVSIGDYVLSGGELAAMVLMDVVVRLLPGALGDDASAQTESFSAATGGGLDYPHYTKPRVWDGRAVPEALLSGDHARIRAWRVEQSRRRTAERRPDLLAPSAGKEPIVVLRDPRSGEDPQISRVHREAFGREAEARLVESLRRQSQLVIDLVAVVDDQIVGHVALSPMRLEGQPSIHGYIGLGPVAVMPGHQCRGIGAALVREAVARARAAAIRAVFVLGDPAWYRRFGFEPAALHGFAGNYDAVDDFQILVLRPPIPDAHRGRVHYAPAFAGV